MLSLYMDTISIMFPIYKHSTRLVANIPAGEPAAKLHGLYVPVTRGLFRWPMAQQVYSRSSQDNTEVM